MAKKRDPLNESSPARKKSSSKAKLLGQELLAHDVAATVETADVAGEFQTEPNSGDECILWRDGDVHGRIRAALSVWSTISPDNITAATTLGQLAVGTGIPWNEGNQGRLVQATNEQNVFFPFQ